MKKPMVTAEQILDLLPLVADRGWAEDLAAGIRMIRDLSGRCPLCALFHEIDPNVDRHFAYMVAADELLGPSWNSESALSDIANAADHAGHRLRNNLRQALEMQ